LESSLPVTLGTGFLGSCVSKTGLTTPICKIVITNRMHVKQDACKCLVNNMCIISIRLSGARKQGLEAHGEGV
jgi:hypothetical protein